MAGTGKPQSFRTLEREGSYEFTEKKSRFIGYAAPALEEPDAQAYIESVKARHPGCSAVLYAYICGYSGGTQRYHDSHEPSGGLLMLEALKRQAVTGAVTAVVRYYGGIQLGAGPLGRAFGLAAAQAVADANPCTVETSHEYAIEFDYGLTGKLDYFFEHSPHRLQGMEYGEKVLARVLVRAGNRERFLGEIADLTGGAAQPALLGETYLRWE